MTASPLFPPVEPYNTDTFSVSDGHTLYYEEVGNPRGIPALFLHGGPGVGIIPDYRRFFDPKHFRIILFDQRGAGKSQPYAAIENNTTWHLVDDIEKLRCHLNVEQFIIMGGSWGSLLALCYAIQHPNNVKGLILRGVFLGRATDADWLYGGKGTAKLFPEGWAEFKRFASVENNWELISTYHQLLNDRDETKVLAAARAWNQWSAAAVSVNTDLSKVHLDDNIATARLECYYSLENFFLPSSNYVLENAANLVNISCHIVHGRFDTICTVDGAWELHQAWPNSVCHIIPGAAHSPLESGMSEALIQASNNFIN